ncbi:VOC family protein, partial [Microbacterium lushaniae]
VVDRLWTALTADGGRPGPCGWLTDRYGLSWQIVPAVLFDLLAGPDRAAADRVGRVVLASSKLDTDALTRAAAGEATSTPT